MADATVLGAVNDRRFNLPLRGFALLSVIPGFIAIALWIAAISLGIYLALASLR
ncbi:MAG: hypothetical protein HC852_23585 [Acaryochloridaceae cyanobacterium RU_4_10]|nr:hypothetical protein [Acaryochloridaceae cyanobacterium RU_4_10]